MSAAFISGCAGVSLSDAERSFFRDVRPVGLILFKRNCETPEQVRALTDSFREIVGEDVLVLVDQEGGRVQRMAAPHWRILPSAKSFADLYDRDPSRACHAARVVARLCAFDLSNAGINMNCVPVLDVPAPDGHEIIGTRAYGNSVESIVALGKEVAEGHLAGGVAPVIKHIPGHGRATADSHLELPRLSTSLSDLKTADFETFRQLNTLPAGMTAHVVYDALDPTECASTSAKVIEDTIRGYIGFDGLLMSDDLSMKALDGEMTARTERVLGAGCDLGLHCNGKLEEMYQVAEGAGTLSAQGQQRLDATFAAISAPQSIDLEEAEAVLGAMLTMTQG